MSNILIKEHYACIIDTNTSISSPSIGLTDGSFYFVTDGYTPTVADVWEEGYVAKNEWLPNEFTWNTDLMDKDGIGVLSQKLDPTAGGDYAYLSTASVKLVNLTNLGNTVHKTIQSLNSLSVLGGDMTIFAIIDGTWYPKWTGQVTGKSFSDTTYTFTGADKKTNSTDTLNDIIIGLINADTTYNPTGDIKIENLLAYRFDYDEITTNVEGIDVTNQANWRRKESGLGNIHFVNDDAFNGVGRGTDGIILKPEHQTSLSFIVQGTISSDIIPEVTDVIKFNSDDSFRVITNIDTVVDVSSGYYTWIMDVASLDDSIDYTFLFGDPKDEFLDTTDVHQALNTITQITETPDGDVTGDKCFFTIYKPVADTGITVEDIADDGVITVINEGVEYDFPYVKNGLGGIVITQPSASNQIKPTSVRYFSTEENIFAQTTDRDWGQFETELASATTLDLANDMNPDSEFVQFGDATDINSTFHWFYLEFDEDDLKDRDTLNLGTLIKGVYQDDWQAWEGLSSQSQQVLSYTDNSVYKNDPADTPITNPSDKTFARADELAATQARYFNVETFNMVKDLTHGRIPVSKNSFTLPNVIDNLNSVIDDGVNPGGGGYSFRYNFKSSSIPVTNLPQYDNKAISIYDSLRVYRNDQSSPILEEGKTLYVQGLYDSDAKACESNTIGLLVGISSTNADDSNWELRQTNDTEPFFYTKVDMIDQQRLTAMINGFCLFETFDMKSEIDITFKANTQTANNSIVDILKEVTENDGDYSGISSDYDDWTAGLQVQSQVQRYTEVTSICKQSFICGFTDRWGESIFKSFPERGVEYHTIDNDNILTDSIKNFTTTPIAKVYNEFKLQGDFNTIEIKNVIEPSFPLFGEDYSDYVTGIYPYDKAKAYWEKAHNAYLTSQAIHKLPTDRGTLKYATSIQNKPDYFVDETDTSIGYIDRLGDIEVGKTALLYNSEINPDTFFDISDEVTFSNANGDYIVAVITSFLTIDSAGLQVIEVNLTDPSAIFEFSFNKSYRDLEYASVYAEEYLEKLLDWTTFPKLTVKFDVPVNASTLTWNIMDEVRFNDPIITPDIGEYGEGWLTSISLNPKNTKMSCEVLFTPSFFMFPPALEPVDVIYETGDALDVIYETGDAPDVIVEGM